MSRGRNRRSISDRFYPLRFAVLFLAIPALGAGSAFGQASQQPSSAQKAGQNKAPIVVDGRTLFYVEERVLSFSAADRARAIGERIEKLCKEPQSSLNAIHVEEIETTSEIMAGDLVIMAVTERDAQAAGRSRQQLANEYTAIIRAAAEELRKEHSLKTILLGILWTLLSTIVLFLAFKLLKTFFPKLYLKLDSWRGTRIRSFRIQKLELLNADRITDALITVAKGTRIAAVLILFYFYLPLVFSFFPWTRGWAAVMFEYVMRPVRLIWDAAVEYLPNFFFIAVILVVAYYAIKLIRFVFKEIGKGTIEISGFYQDWAEPTYKIVRFLLIAFTAIVAFPYVPGSQSPAFRGVSIFLGLLFSLGSTSAVAHIVAGMMLTYTRAFQNGDRVKIGETMGDVIEKTMLVTRIRTIKNVDISIPNAMVLSSHIINYSSSAQEKGLILNTSVTIGYDAPWRQVHELLIAAACDTEHILKEPKPFVLQTSLGDFFVSYELNAFTDQPLQMASVYSDLHQNIQDKFNEAGVEIMSPHYGAVRDGNSIAIPPEYVPKEYQAPPFRILPVEDLFKRKRKETEQEG
jgi:small-conductance mechanosensitive channel